MLRFTSLLAVSLSALALGSAGARADSLDDHLGPRELAMGDAQRGDARGGLSINLNPAGLALSREVAFEGSYGYRFTDSASTAVASACDSTVVIPGCFYYRYMSATPDEGGVAGARRAHEGGITGARMLSPNVLIGSNVKYYDYNTDLAGDEEASGFVFDLGTTVRAVDILTVAFAGHHLFGKRSSQYPRALSAGIAVRPLPILSIFLDGLWRLDHPDGEATGRYGGGVELFLGSKDLQSGYALRGGAAHDVQNDGTYVSGGAGFAGTKVAVDVGLRYQVGGGDETVIQASLRVFGPRQIPGTGSYR